MSNLKFNQGPLQNSVLPNLNDGIGHLSTAIGTLGSANSPSSYRYSGDLNRINSELENIKKILQNEYNHMNSSLSKIVRKEEELEQYASSLPVTEIIKRNHKI